MVRVEKTSGARPASVSAPTSQRSLPPWLREALLGGAGVLVLLLLWSISTHLAAPDSFIRRFSPESAFTTLVKLCLSSDLPIHTLVSLKRLVVGLAFALLIGVPAGLAVGSLKWLEAATTPAFQFLRMISPLSWMPIAVMLFGVGDDPIYFLLAFAAVWPILLSTAAGVRQLDRRWLQLAESLAATRWEIIRRVVVPGALSHVLTGVRLAIGILWIVMVPCEMLGVSAGLGYFILDTRDRLAYPELMATVLLIGVLGFLLDALARALCRRWS
jgi:NitT/TauT family transport system permease protein